MRRTTRTRKSKTPLAKAKTNLWKVLKEVIAIRDGDKCISCGADGLSGHNKHGGHFIASSSCGGFLRYDLRNVWVQCATCNLYRNGAGAEYTRALQHLFGDVFVDKIIEDKKKIIKLDVDYVIGMTEFYKTLFKKNQKQLIKFTKEYNGFQQT